MALILDSGGMIVALDPNQNDHQAFAKALTSHRGPLIISPFVVAELDYMLLRRYGTRDILTTDQRDFRRVTLPDGRYFRILPYDL